MVERLYAALLLAFPRRFRARYSDAMRQIFRERYRRAADEGRAAAAAFLTRSAIDVLSNAALERVAAARQWLNVRRVTTTSVIAAHEHERRLMFWQALTMDVRYAVRMFVRSPGFTAVAVAALALGIGANSAIFAVVNSILLQPLPYIDADRLVMVWSVNEAQRAEPSAMFEGDVIDIRRATTTMARLEAFQANLVPMQMRFNANTMSAQAVAVTPDTFSLLGREALVGRTLRAGDRFTIVLSHGYWQRQFSGDPHIVGRQVTIGSTPADIVGVMPPDFAFPYRSMLRAPISFTRIANVDLWVPMKLADARPPREDLRLLGAVARMKPGVTVEQTRAEVDVIARRLAREHPASNAGWTATAVPAHEQAVDPVRSALLLLLAGVSLVLLMACVNVANLLLARSMRRQREMAVRAALGAGRGRLLRQTLTESVLLSMVGAAAAWVVVRWAIRAFVAIAPGEIPRLSEVTPDWRVAMYTGAIALVTGVATGLVPAFAASGFDVQRRLADATRGTVGVSGRRTRTALVVAEVALALVLTVGAGLLVRSFLAVLRVDPGFRTENLLTMQVTMPARHKTPDQRREFYRQLFARLEAIPGVITVGGATRLPLGGANSSTSIAVEGRDHSRGLLAAGLRRAMHNYFAAMGMTIVRGRGFDVRDGPEAPRVVVINETMARRVFPGEDPIGKRVRLGENAGIGLATIVGIVSDVRHEGLEAAPESEIYIHYLQNPPTGPLIVMRTSGDPGVLAAEVRTAAREVDPMLGLYDIRTMEDLRAHSVSQRKFMTLLAAMFGILAVTLAGVGVYGVMALVITERTREIGVRIALGAEPAQVLRLVVRYGLGVAAIGAAIGGVASLGLTPMMASQLYGIGPLDPITFGGIPVLLLAVALLACVVPARRAMRVDPVIALRTE